MFGGFKKKLDEAKAKASEVKERLNSVYVRGQSGNQSVEVIMSANREVTEVNVQDNYQELPKESLSRSIQEAVNDAITKADTVNATEMQAVTKEYMPNIPGMDMGKMFS